MVPPLPLAQASDDGLLDIVLAGGPVGMAIMALLAALSMTALALVVEHALTIRRGVLAPPGVDDELVRAMRAGDLAAAARACDSQPCFLSAVTRAGLSEADAGWPAVEKGMEDAAGDQTARLLRKIEYLSVIGNIAPMVGLLGTVVGMLLAFREVAQTDGAATASQLASGIYQALVTTVAGLLVAIPALGAFAVFRNRVDGLASETAHRALQLLKPLKRGGVMRPKDQQPARQ
ncbi:Biopolymer transport protein ExbB [Pseudobythopirellula maris]|uniref:Biopolymer transport protein ExbB n=1 Tax=Pseudobythopirellula maris TaxID=2527991 RepID=A0A5C5ZV53_9BACT|nr:MotA/TolQ/ExbB proton channel family protein [Pseudobythopirellula maris]TWT90928.1 Biopolymer transport protein ExbB [Pseudobythopirellula maris]